MPDASGARLAPDKTIALRFFQVLTGETNPTVRVKTFPDSKTAAGRSIEREGPVEFWWSDIVERQAQGHGVFYFLNTIKAGPGSGKWRDGTKNEYATGDDVVAIRACAADHDAGIPREWHLQPPLIVHTSAPLGKDFHPIDHGQSLWPLVLGSMKLGDFTEAQLRLAARYGSDDSISDLPRVLRVPGTLHQKDPSDIHLVTFEDHTGGRAFADYCLDPAKLLAGLPMPKSNDGTVRPYEGKNRSPTPDGVTWDAQANIDIGRADLKRMIAQGPNGQVGKEGDGANGRDNTLFKAAAQLRDRMISPEVAIDLLWETLNPQFVPPYDDIGDGSAHSFLHPIDSAYGGNASNANPGTKAHASFAFVFRDVPVPKSETTLPSQAERAAPGEEPFLLDIDAMLTQPDPTELVGGLLMEHENVCFAGPPKVGKSFIALDICLSIAANVPVFGFLPVNRSGAVVYLSGEGHAGFKRRIKAWLQDRGQEGKKIPFFYKKTVPVSSAGITECIRYIEGIKTQLGTEPVLVVIDTMARSLGGEDENSAAAANLYLAMTETLRDKLDCTVLTLAHAGKLAEKSGDIEIRGSSAFTAGFDAVWAASFNKENKTVKMEAKWLKDADELGPFGFRLEHVQVEGMEKGRGAVLRSVDPSMLKNKPDHRAQQIMVLQDFLQKFGAVTLQTALDKTTFAHMIAVDLMKPCDANPGSADAKEWNRKLNETKQKWEKELEEGTRQRRGKTPRYVGLYETTVKEAYGGRLQNWFYLKEPGLLSPGVAQ